MSRSSNSIDVAIYGENPLSQIRPVATILKQILTFSDKRNNIQAVLQVASHEAKTTA